MRSISVGKLALRRHVALLALGLAAYVSYAQKLDPVEWSLRSEAVRVPPGANVALRLRATIEPGWHLYSLTTPKGGAIPTTVSVLGTEGMENAAIYQPRPERHFDANFNLDTETFADEVALLVVGKVKNDAPVGMLDVTAEVRYQACSDRQCLPPRKKTAALRLAVDPAATAGPNRALPAGYTLVPAAGQSQPQAVATETPKRQDGLPMFLLTAFGLGVAAVFTPCVFPMVPITVSFFLKRRGGVAQAAVFSFGIVTLFCLLGLGITAVAGPFGVVQLGASPWVNGFIAAVFGVFALSLLGAFEIALPSGVLTKLDEVSRREGYIGTLLMGLTFSLTSFACVGPFVGSLLAASVQTPGSQPVLGMLSFATGLSAPFFLLAAFPSYLSRLPKSGNWLLRVKVVMGFVLLAAMLKYLSNIDQVLQIGLLTRERFLASWLVLFSLAGLYLLGFLRLPGISSDEPLGVGRLLTGGVLLVFAFSLQPGMSGSSLGELDAYVPASSTNGARPAGGAEALVWLKNQYPEALARAQVEHKPVLVDFSGNACTNCHWMKANMFNQPEVEATMKNFILVELYTDGTDEESVRNQEMESSKYGTVALPFYVIVSPGGDTIATFPGLTREAAKWQDFLGQGTRQLRS